MCGPGAPCNCDLGKTHRLALDYRLTGLTERPLGRLETPVFDLTSGWVHQGTRPALARSHLLSAVFEFLSLVRASTAIITTITRFWLVHRGKAKVFTDGVAHYVQAGDVVITQAGDAHDILEVYEDLEGFFVETGLPSGRPSRSSVQFGIRASGPRGRVGTLSLRTSQLARPTRLRKYHG